ncbi:MAG: nucleotidyl transferase AbiEii/AbiGii toxin family protein [Verrucomicrobia bacterium]|nr:nucleotidyl transferase AbiEii/AbiGii toxin family protein [Verrucomicrobiota bacterium]
MNLAKTRGVAFNRVLVQYGIERVLYRLAESKHRDKFILKGAMLFVIW